MGQNCTGGGEKEWKVVNKKTKIFNAKKKTIGKEEIENTF